MSKLTEFLYAASDATADSEKAIIILPEIYGVKKFTRNLADSVENETGWSSYVLDHFYAVTGQVQEFDYTDMAGGSSIMDQMTGELYLPLLESAIGTIRARQPDLRRLAIWGFCFGGKLAYLSGVNPRVTEIISFYGGASSVPGFYAGDSAVTALSRARQGDTALRILAGYGVDDPMITADDRQKVDAALTVAKLTHKFNIYRAGHAFFNQDREDRYNAIAAQAAQADVWGFLKA